MTLNELLISIELGLIYSIVALGIYITFKVIDFQDLTCDGSFVLGATVSTMTLLAGYSPLSALLLAMIAGALAGLTTSLLSEYGKIPQLLSGIIVAFMLYSVNCSIMKGIPNRAINFESTIFYTTNSLIVISIMVTLVWALVSYLLITEWGLALQSIGLNKRLALTMGVNIPLTTCIGLLLSNGLIALAGALLSQYQGFADVSQGTGTLIIGLAGVIIGTIIIKHKNIWTKVASCIIGALLYRIIIGCALHSTHLGLPSYALNFITGMMLLGILLTTKGRTCSI